MTPALAALIAQLIPLGIQAYNEFLAANPNSGLPSTETILAQADANWAQVQQEAQAQIAALTPPTS